MDNANSILLNRFFTRNTFKEVIDEGESSAYIAAIRRYIVDSANKTNDECISEIYQYLRKEYQNEYYYKNTLLNKLLLGVHSPRTTTALTEVPVAKSKADFILINGKAVVYEIKTALDNFDRLDGQIEDYYKAFSRVVVVTSENNPDVSQFEYYRSCQALFESLPIDTAYQMFIQTLKLRTKVDIVEYSKVPYELKFLIYFSNYKKSDYVKLNHFLSI